MFFVAAVLLPIVLALVAVAFLRRTRARAASASTRLGWPALVVGNALVLLALAATAFLAFETYYRFFFDQTDSWGMGIAHERWFERHWRRNAMGMRDDVEYDLARGEAPRVTFVGDSFTAAHGVADVSQRFVNLVRRARPGWEVQMLAFPGADTPQQIDAITRAAETGYEFDHVVLVYGLNDIGQAHPRAAEVIERLYADSAADGFLMRNSYALNTLYHRYRVRGDADLDDYFGFVRSYYSGPVWSEQARRLTDLRRAVERNGGRLLVVTFPFLHALGDDYDHRDAHRTLAEHWEEYGVPHLDLLPLFVDRDPADLVVNRYDAHPNETAHALAAAAILEFLDANVP